MHTLSGATWRRVLWLLVLVAASYVGPARGDELTGRWPSGRWESHTSGHDGPLRATFRRVDDCHYRVTFRGRFWGVVPFRYAVTLTVRGREGDRVILSGESNLGLLLGTFTYDAEATATEFVATYTSRRDHGTFTLCRPAACDPCSASAGVNPAAR